jgi:hypothetical protein
VQLVLLTIYPTLIQPLFNKVTPLEPSPLRTAIEALAQRVHFPLTQLYVIDGSKRSGHSNGTPWRVRKHTLQRDRDREKSMDVRRRHTGDQSAMRA